MLLVAPLLFLLALAPDTAQPEFDDHPTTWVTTSVADTVEVNEIEWTARSYIASRDSVGFGEISGYFASHLPKIYAGVQSSGMEIDGAATGLFWAWDTDNMQTYMAAAVPVSEATGEIEGYEVVEIPAGPALQVDYFGSYEEMTPVHEALDAYGAEHDYAEPIVVIEEYLTDPQMEPDTSKWHTRITYVYAE